jgi:hypothetical protein
MYHAAFIWQTLLPHHLRMSHACTPKIVSSADDSGHLHGDRLSAIAAFSSSDILFASEDNRRTSLHKLVDVIEADFIALCCTVRLCCTYAKFDADGCKIPITDGILVASGLRPAGSK